MTEQTTRRRKKAETPAKPALVKMVRPDGKTADVHPDEVENYRKGNYREA